jgi:radical SAM superfamily enzyme YgiQ (UPF0313 family)
MKQERPLLYLINPRNALEEMSGHTGWTRVRVWPPLSIITVAGLTPDSWEVQILDENSEIFDYETMPRPDLVGITAFTSQAARAYEVASTFRQERIPVVMGGIHASMCKDEAQRFVDSVVVGEAETVWTQVLEDTLRQRLQPLYSGTRSEWLNSPPARHDLVKGKYVFGTLQTTRGCPLGCSFCSVTAFNGRKYRHRPTKDVLDELELIPGKLLLFADDNLIGTRKDHMEYAKNLFRGMIKRGIRKYWSAQVTINMADDPELLRLAKRSGCIGVYIGFESPNPESIKAVNKNFNLRFGINYYREAVRRIHKAGIGVTGAFIIGIDNDRPGAAEMIISTVKECQIDAVSVSTLTPLPGTELYDQMANEERLTLTNYPKDWKYYNLVLPTCKFKNLNWSEIERERDQLYKGFLSKFKILISFLRTLMNTKDLRVSVIFLLFKLSAHRNWHIYNKIRNNLTEREKVQPVKSYLEKGLYGKHLEIIRSQGKPESVVRLTQHPEG